MNIQRVKSGIKHSANNGRLQSLAILLFFMSIVLMNQISNFMAVGFFYLTSILAFAVGFYGNGKKLRLSKTVAIFFALIAITGLINIIYPGNSTFNKQMYTLISVGIAFSMLYCRTDKWVYLWVFLLNAVIVFVQVLINGARGPIYVNSSVNYVSVHLLCPLVLFYSEREKQEEKILLWPAVLAWVLCLIVQGRAGILFCSFFLCGLLFLRFFPVFQGLEKKKKQMICGVLAGIFVLAILLGWAFDVIHNVPIFARFAEFGLGGNGRGPLWGDYLTATFASIGNVLFAPNMNEIKRVTMFSGNLHNSFLNIHAFNGLLMLVVVLALCLFGAIYAVKNKKWIFLLCFATFCMRGFTDYVFWGNFATPFFFYFIFTPFTGEGKYCCWVIEFDKVMIWLNEKKPVVMDKLLSIKKVLTKKTQEDSKK